MTRRGWPCPDVKDAPCYCRCHAIGWARSNSRRLRWDAWLATHDDMLRSLVADGQPPEIIAAALSTRSTVPRTALAVRRRIRRLGLSTRDGWWSREDVIKRLGLHQAALERWEAAGLLPSAPYGKWRRYREPDLEAFVKAHAGWLFDPRRVRDDRLRRLAEVSAQANARRPV